MGSLYRIIMGLYAEWCFFDDGWLFHGYTGKDGKGNMNGICIWAIYIYIDIWRLKPQQCYWKKIC